MTKLIMVQPGVVRNMKVGYSDKELMFMSKWSQTRKKEE